VAAEAEVPAQLEVIDRLRQVSVEAGSAYALTVLLAGQAGEGHGEEPAPPGIGSKTADQLEAVHAGHLQIAHHDVRLPAGQDLERPESVFGTEHPRSVKA
jgi:hypothetical protein